MMPTDCRNSIGIDRIDGQSSRARQSDTNKPTTNRYTGRKAHRGNRRTPGT